MRRHLSLPFALCLAFACSAAGQSAAEHASQGPSSKNERVITVPVKNSHPLSQGEIAYFKAWRTCTAKAVAPHPDQATVLACRQAADLAAQFPPGEDFIGRHSVDDAAALALMNTGDRKSALIYANRAVDVARSDPSDYPDDSEAYGLRARLNAVNGDLVAADRDLTCTERLQRKFLALLVKNNPELTPRWRGFLSGELHFHAQILDRLGRTKEAQEKLDEAAKL